jgi:hypothetical protein
MSHASLYITPAHWTSGFDDSGSFVDAGSQRG